jgi:diguanylate cyclase (GGDEF)-like protein/PAS domain S-box-containing protein
VFACLPDLDSVLAEMLSNKDREKEPAKVTATGWLIPNRRQIFAHVILSAGFVLLYLCLNRPEIILESKLGFTVWYPPAGLILALMLGVSPWYAALAVFADALAGALIYHQPLLSKSETIAPLVGVACYALAAYVLRGPMRIDPGLRRRRDVMRYVTVTLVAAAGSTTAGTLALVADHTITWGQFWSSALSWFMGDAIALLGFAPFLLVHILPWVRRKLKMSEPEDQASRVEKKAEATSVYLGRLAEALGQAAAIVGLLWVMFGGPLERLQLYYLAFVPIIWIAMRHGIKRAVTGLLVWNFGIVAALHVFPPSEYSLLKVGLLMLVVSATGLMLGSAVSERHRLARHLEERTIYMNALIENSPIGIVAQEPGGAIRLCNDAFEKLFQLRRDEITGHDLDNLIDYPSAPREETSDITAEVAAGRPVQKNVRRMRKDGVLLDVQLNAVPLTVEGRIQGNYMMYRDISDQVQAAEDAKKHASSLNQLVNELGLRTMQMTLINEMGALLQCCLTIQEAYGVVAESAKKLFPHASAGALYIFKASRSVLDLSATWGHSCASESIFSPESCWALRRGQPNWSEYPITNVACAHLKEAVDVSYLCVPMVAQGDTLGILHLQFDRAENARSGAPIESLHESQQSLATTVAGQVALSLASLRLAEKLRDQSIRDPLTGLFNRRFMQESLDRELHRAKRKKHSVAVVFLDLDHFKKFNDTFGHDAGDAVLREMADAFRKHFRGDDIICRYGGEEFAVILPESSAQDATKRTAALREGLKKISIRNRGQVLDHVTISVGIAAFPEHGQTVEELLHIADQCLYQSKAQGRDRVTVAEHQPA